MEDIIHLLPDSVANQIAAGEVVQRPASMVKELVENSIDAGASKIDVYVVGGGKTCVQVIDDGKGMSETDARLAFERHSTSKIRQASDLLSLTTMGFRGEALASIAAVAQVDLQTRRPEDQLGTRIQIAGSELVEQEAVSCPAGSNFAVSNLFFNVPARRKFLKSDQTETTNIITEFERIALVHPDVAFTLTNNGNLVHNLPKASLRQRIIDVFGKNINQDLLPIEVDTSIVTISGYVGKPESAKKKGAKQFFFVNGRFMKHPYFHVAVMKAYEQLIPVGEHVSYFVYLAVDPSTIDVNVHPTKTEIKFDNEVGIWQVLSAAVREAIGKFSSVPMIDFDVEGKPDIPVFGTVDIKDVKVPQVSHNGYNPFNTEGSKKRNTRDWGKLYGEIMDIAFDGNKHDKFPERNVDDMNDDIANGDSADSQVVNVSTPHINDMFADRQNGEPANDTTIQSIADNGMALFQYRGRFIVFPSDEGIMFVDQHRAHVRVLFDDYIKRISNRNGVGQGVLFPEIVQFSKQEKIVVDNIMDDLSYIGFELTDLGGGAYSVNCIPTGIEGLNSVDMLHRLVAVSAENTGNVRQTVEQRIALTMAKAAAIVRGQVLTKQEMYDLLKNLFHSTAPMRTPDGKLICKVIDHNAIEKMF